MPHSVSEVERLAQSTLRGILLNDARFEFDALFDHRQQGGVIRIGDVKLQMLHEHLFVFKQGVFQHLGITGTEVLFVERTQELRTDHHIVGFLKCTNLIFIIPEVDSRFAADRSIDHGQKRRGHIDKADAALKCRGGKSTEIRYHAPADIDQQRVARGTGLLQFLPHGGESFEVLMVVAGPHRNEVSEHWALCFQLYGDGRSVLISEPHHPIRAGKRVNNCAERTRCVL